MEVAPASVVALTRACKPAKEAYMAQHTCPAMTASAVELAYWAGLIDGEGHLGIRYVKDRPERPTGASRYIARMSLRMSDLLIVAEFADLFGTAPPGDRSFDNALSTKPIYGTEAGGRRAAHVAALLLPHLRLKVGQAELLIKLEEEKQVPGLRTRYTSTDTHYRNGRPFTRKKFSTGQEHLDRWHRYYEEVKRLNRQGRNAEVPALPEQDDAEGQDQVPVEPDLSLF